VSKAVTIIDYGVSNILSISRAFEFCGARVHITDKAQEVQRADYLVLPGVGAFAYGMQALAARNLVDAICSFVQLEKPFLGVCLGLQMMFDRSFELGTSKGLGIVHGDVVVLPSNAPSGERYKLPHIAWGALSLVNSNDEVLVRNVAPQSYVYFVHSFCACPEQNEAIRATASFHEYEFAAIIRKNNACGVQFHPEKSGDVGLTIIRNFLSL